MYGLTMRLTSRGLPRTSMAGLPLGVAVLLAFANRDEVVRDGGSCGVHDNFSF